MESKLILSKNSSENEIKRYFKAVLKLAQSDDEFPINLDEVWPLVYSEKGKAVRALTSNEQFIEGVDYKTLAQNGKQDETSWGGNNKIDYKLTVSYESHEITGINTTVLQGREDRGQQTVARPASSVLIKHISFFHYILNL